MVTAEELTVAIRSEGVGETRQDLEGVEAAMEDTAESAGESAAELEGFSERFKGAMSAAVAALAVGAAGLLSQVPVLGEAFAGLGAIVQALAFQMDSVLRPVLQPITSFFFDIANAIFNLEGLIGAFVGGLTTLASVILTVTGVVAALFAQFGIGGTVLASIVAIIGVAINVVLGLAAAIASLPAIALAAIAGIVAFAAAYALNLGGVRDTTNRILGQVFQFFVGLASDLASWAGGLASDAFTWGKNALGRLVAGVRQAGVGVVQWFDSLAADLATWASDTASDAFEWGASIVERIIDGITSVIDTLRDKLNDLRDIAPGVSIDAPGLGGGDGGDGGGGGGGDGGLFGTGFRPFRGGGGGSGRGGTRIDGRQLSESTGRYRADPGRRRGL